MVAAACGAGRQQDKRGRPGRQARWQLRPQLHRPWHGPGSEVRQVYGRPSAQAGGARRIWQFPRLGPGPAISLPSRRDGALTLPFRCILATLLLLQIDCYYCVLSCIPVDCSLILTFTKISSCWPGLGSLLRCGVNPCLCCVVLHND